MNLDMVWLFVVYSSVLAFIAICVIIALKIGILSFKVVVNTVIAAKNIENIEGPISGIKGIKRKMKKRT